ncbi:hypothetical protein JQN72_17895 [Phycicoccus sp. CSK15P-2]|uniref:RCC1 domain-containing protein n=1 Tax=Phycicoccus sp. CSK15P-2 TaxID=2807627 RepID=UPI001951ACC3|nr:RCC1 domain-containing protein [Phycicoccus sp. CSK15P-2]MBM6406109.1 hypothetical protein [Phycicoccus sp. CSK15P-2]
MCFSVLAASALAGVSAVTATAAPVAAAAASQPSGPAVTGGHHTCRLDTEGAAWCWGLNDFGQLGDGTEERRYTPTRVATDLTFTSLTLGRNHTCGVATDGAAWCWGRNEFGQVGDGTTVHRNTPQAVLGGEAFSSLSAGFFQTCGLVDGPAGQVSCWGRNNTGQLGDGTKVNRSTPAPVVGGQTFTSVSAHFGYSCALDDSDQAWCWGRNDMGQLGDGTFTGRTVPGPSAEGHDFASLIGPSGTHSCGIDTDGVTWCWGSNRYGQLGIGDDSVVGSPTPLEVITEESGAFTSVSAGGGYHTCGINADGEAWCWGGNVIGQLGDGTTVDSNRPVQVVLEDGIELVSIDTGIYHSCGVDTAGDAWCWGSGGPGQLGDGTHTSSSTPLKVADFQDSEDVDASTEPAAG